MCALSTQGVQILIALAAFIVQGPVAASAVLYYLYMYIYGGALTRARDSFMMKLCWPPCAVYRHHKESESSEGPRCDLVAASFLCCVYTLCLWEPFEEEDEEAYIRATEKAAMDQERLNQRTAGNRDYEDSDSGCDRPSFFTKVSAMKARIDEECKVKKCRQCHLWHIDGDNAEAGSGNARRRRGYDKEEESVLGDDDWLISVVGDDGDGDGDGSRLARTGDSRRHHRRKRKKTKRKKSKQRLESQGGGGSARSLVEQEDAEAALAEAAAAEAEAEDNTPPLLGQRVRLAKIIGQWELNGSCGLASQWLEDRGCYEVVLDARPASPVALRGDNLSPEGAGHSPSTPLFDIVFKHHAHKVFVETSEVVAPTAAEAPEAAAGADPPKEPPPPTEPTKKAPPRVHGPYPDADEASAALYMDFVLGRAMDEGNFNVRHEHVTAGVDDTVLVIDDSEEGKNLNNNNNNNDAQPRKSRFKSAGKKVGMLVAATNPTMRKKKIIKSAFSVMDKDGSGAIDWKEFSKARYTVYCLCRLPSTDAQVFRG